LQCGRSACILHGIRSRDASLHAPQACATPSRGCMPTLPLPADHRPPRLLIVDDEPAMRLVLREILSAAPYDVVEAPDGQRALELFLSQGADAIVADVLMPHMSGLELLRRVRAVDDDVAFVMITGAGTLDGAVEALRLQVDDYLLKPFDVEAVTAALGRALACRGRRRDERRRLAERIDQQARQLDQVFVDGLLAISMSVEARDRYTGGHVERVATYAVATGVHLGLAEDDLKALLVAALLHDIGKIAVPDHILGKPGALTPEECSVIREHPAGGAAILARSPTLAIGIPGVLHHHERWDGGGYPHGLAGEEIPLAGRILAVADTFDAIVTARPYRGPRSTLEALAELRRCQGTQFDPRVLDAFTQALDGGFQAVKRVRYAAALPWRDLPAPHPGSAATPAGNRKLASGTAAV
jgi:putative two-component system response regulator